MTFIFKICNIFLPYLFKFYRSQSNRKIWKVEIISIQHNLEAGSKQLIYNIVYQRRLSVWKERTWTNERTAKGHRKDRQVGLIILFYLLTCKHAKTLNKNTFTIVTCKTPAKDNSGSEMPSKETNKQWRRTWGGWCASCLLRTKFCMWMEQREYFYLRDLQFYPNFAYFCRTFSLSNSFGEDIFKPDLLSVISLTPASEYSETPTSLHFFSWICALSYSWQGGK